MARLTGLQVLVAGAGAIGSTVALRLRLEGARVTLADAAPAADNASGVAAGMLAPAFEALLDPASAGHFALLRAARDAWTSLAGHEPALQGHIDRSGALWVADEAGLAGAAASLDAIGAAGEQISADQAVRLSPGLVAPAGAVFTPEDWRLDAGSVLAALHEAFAAVGGERRPARLVRAGGGVAELEGGEAVAADEMILATGLAPSGLEDPLPGLAALTPIKGQIVRLAAEAPSGGPVARSSGVYVVPTAGGVIAGATMEMGVSDRTVDPAVVDGLRKAAAALYPPLAKSPGRGSAGVRAATPDGLPMVGPVSPGLRLALGARRNGWLLAPLVAEVLADQLAGAAPGGWDQAFDPLRFNR